MTHLFPLSPKRCRRLGIIIAAGIVLSAIYFFINPYGSQFAPKCIFHLLTGFDCAGCGSQRMLHALLHADFANAWNANPFLLIVSPYLILWIWVETDPDANPNLHRRMNSLTTIIIILATALCWTILRNLLNL